eukprot:11846174-Karenia_brevis.AAC.1
MDAIVLAPFHPALSMVIPVPHHFFLSASIILGDVFFFTNPFSFEAPGAIIFIMHGGGVKAGP